MMSVFAPVSERFHIGPWPARLVGALGLLGLAAVVALATRQDALALAIAFIVVALAVVIGFRWPMLTLAAFVVLIPIEELAVIDGVGSISRFAGILFAVTYGLPRLSHLSPRLMPAAGWTFLAWSMLSIGWAIDPNTSWGQLVTLAQLFLIALLIADVVAQRPALVRPILWVYSISASATAVVGIQTFISLGPNAEARAAAIGGQDPAQFAAILLPAFVFGLFEVVNHHERILGGAVALLTAAGILVSGTRGAWLSVAVVAIVFIFPRLRLRSQIWAAALIVTLGIVTLQIPGVSTLVLQRAQSAIVSGGSGRTDIWAVGLTVYGTAPLLGVGYANFPVAYTSDAVGATNVVSGLATGEGSGPHNLVIGTLTELGPVGLILLVLFLGPLLIRPGWGPDAAMIQAALVSLLITALFLDILANRKQVWLIIGIAAGLAFLRRAREASGRQPDVVTLDAAAP